MASRVWESLSLRFSGIEIDAFVVMPNHIHGIINVGAQLQDPRAVKPHEARATTRVALTEGRAILGRVIGAYKSLTTVEYTRGIKTYGWPPFERRLWQRNYYEHVVRDDESFRRVRQYIVDNPAQWIFDRENPMSEASRDVSP